MTGPLTFFLALLAATQWSLVRSASSVYRPNGTEHVTALPFNPRPVPAYMVDNQYNSYHVAPDKGKQNGPVWNYSGSLNKYLTNLRRGTVVRGGYTKYNGTRQTTLNATVNKRQSSGYWLTSLGPKGAQPLAGGNDYQFFRNVVDDFGADKSGETDATEAINAAVASWNKNSVDGAQQTRCGQKCGNTFAQGAIVYFPPGIYKICTPVIQYYYTQFIGDPNDMPTIKGCNTFQGIALFDTDPYIPGGSGSQWYLNQHQFFRQIRNFIFDLTDMPESTSENNQDLVPTGIHWQVAQATSLQNLIFKMPKTSTTTAIGIFSENGSGGFVSDLIFTGGNIGWRAGSQQYTARNLQFNYCNTAVQMIWDWGWNWQQVTVNGGSIAFNISGVGGPRKQGTGSVSIIDTVISNTTTGILTNGLGTSPNIVLDNTVFKGVTRPVQVEGGSTMLSGSSALWATGKRYNGSVSSTETGDVTAPQKAKGLLDSKGFLYVRSRPQYEGLSASSFSVATTDGGCKNDGTGDQTSCLNIFLQKAAGAGQVAYFPAGIYTVGGTVLIPMGSRVQGSSWSQIQGSGFYFSDMHDPKVVVRVGNQGDVGTMEIVEMLFSVRGATAGAVLMEWNTAASSQGVAAMWDSHFRVGGALGTDLDLATCPKFSTNEACIGASLMFHVTPQANGYFENVWAWVGDHDNDQSIFNQSDSTITQIAVFGARGTLVESQGPSWFYGSGSEHSVLYNYLLSGAKSIYMGHVQTESPYFQPVPGAPAPFGAAASFPNDPDFSQCSFTANSNNEQCRYSWGMQIIDSTDVTIHSAGLYSFFNNFCKDCIDTQKCQERILEVRGSTGVAIYNLFTIAIIDVGNGIDGSKILQTDGIQRGFTTEVSVWLPLPGADTVDIVWVDTGIWQTPTVTCSSPPCLLILPTKTLPSKTTITPSSYVTSFEFRGIGPTSIGGTKNTAFITTTTVVTIIIPTIVTDGIPYSNVNVTGSGPTSITAIPSVNIPPIGVLLPDGSGGMTTRTVTLPPWPQVNAGPTVASTDPGAQPVGTGGLPGSSTTYYTSVGITLTVPSATVTTLSFPATVGAITISCPATTSIVFATPAIAVATRCTSSGSLTFNFACPTTKVATFLAAATTFVAVDCSLVTSWSTGQTSTTTPLPIFVTWPSYGQIIPVATIIDKPQPTSDGVVVPCKAWFFFICISWGEIHIGAWHWILPPGIYGPGPPPIGLIKWPPGFRIQGNLPNWPKITIGRDNQMTTEDKSECKTQTAEACTTTTYISADKTVSSASMCETISGCSISVSDSSTIEVIGTQTPAPIGTWYAEAWATMTLGDAYTNSVYSAMSVQMAADEVSADATTISYTTGPTAGPTCVGATTACGGTLCSGYWCTSSPTSNPPGYQDPKDPKDPSSGGSLAPTTHIVSTVPPTTKPTTRPCTATNVCNCNENGCDACSPACCANGTCGGDLTTALPPVTTPVDRCASFNCQACGSPFDDPCCQLKCTG